MKIRVAAGFGPLCRRALATALLLSACESAGVRSGSPSNPGVNPSRPGGSDASAGVNNDAFVLPPGKGGSAGSSGAGGAGGSVTPATETMACAGTTFTGKPVPVDLLFMVDVSMSMEEPVEGGQSKWTVAKEALTAFIRDPGSAGLGVGMNFFPIPDGGGGLLGEPVCAPAAYAALRAPIAELPGNATALTTAITQAGLSFGTPIASAIQGGYLALRTHLAKNPGRKGVLVLVTDGEPSTCPPLDGDAIAQFAAAAVAESPSLLTYVVGIFSPMQFGDGIATAEKIAVGGGTAMPFVVAPNKNLGKELLNALAVIRGDALPCEFQVPKAMPGMPVDFGKVSVQVTPTGGTQTEIPFVARAAQCDGTRGGWYYDVDATQTEPTRIILCPKSCEQVKAAKDTRLDLRLGCKPKEIG